MKLTNNGMGRVYKLYTLLCYILPMVALFIFNYDAYSKEEGAFGFWGIVVLMLCVIAFKNFCIDFFKKYRLLSVSLVVTVLGIFSEFLASQLIVIGVVSSGASIVSLVVSVVADVYDEHAFKLVDGEKVINKSPAISQKEAWKEAYGYNLVIVNEKEEKPEENKTGGDNE